MDAGFMVCVEKERWNGWQRFGATTPIFFALPSPTCTGETQ